MTKELIFGVDRQFSFWFILRNFGVDLCLCMTVLLCIMGPKMPAEDSDLDRAIQGQ